MNNKDKVTYLEMARIAMAMIPDDLVDELDMSDDEFLRLRNQLQQTMDDQSSIPEEVHVAVDYYKGLINDVRVSLEDFEERKDAFGISREELYDEINDSGYRLYICSVET